MFQEGDVVEITGKFGNAKGRATVVKASKGRIALDNGDHYTQAGDKLDTSGHVAKRIGQTISKVI